MSAYFDSIFSFALVKKTDKGIDKHDFVKACKDLVTIFDYLSPTAFAPVKNDLMGNINNLEGSGHETLTACITKDEVDKAGTTSCAALWLTRGLNFTCTALQTAIDHPDKELSSCFSTAYSNTLAKHHAFYVKPIFAIAMKAIPYRKDFYANLSGGKTEKDIDEKQREWVGALSTIVKELTVLLGKE